MADDCLNACSSSVVLSGLETMICSVRGQGKTVEAHDRFTRSAATMICLLRRVCCILETHLMAFSLLVVVIRDQITVDVD